EEASCSCERLLPEQEQALSRRERVGRHGAEVRVRRPPKKEARLPPPVGDADQCGGSRAWTHLWPADRGPEGGGQHARSQEPRGARGVVAGVVREARRDREERAGTDGGRAPVAAAPDGLQEVRRSGDDSLDLLTSCCKDSR